MAGSDLIKSINGSFLLGLSGFAADLGISGGGGSSLLGGAAQSDKIQLALRVGARTFAKAVEGLNSVINVVNISDATLEKLSGITDKLIELAEKSSKSNISNETRGRYDRDFQKLAKEFQRVVAQTKQDGQDLLSVEGLQEIFAIIGLNEEESKSIAEVFSKFVTNKEDKALASQETKGTRPVIVPIGAYPISTTTPAYELVQISKNGDATAVTNGLISRTTSVYADNVDYHYQNPNGNITATYVRTDGTQSALPASINYDVTLMAVSEMTGYSVIASQEDFLGFNPSNNNNLFIVNSAGEVIHQVTNAGSGWSFYGADISSDGTRAVFTLDDGLIATGYGDASISNIGGDPANPATQTTWYDSFGLGTVTLGSITVSEDGSHLAYSLTAGGTNYLAFRDTATHTLDLTVLSVTDTFTRFGFIGSNKLALYNSATEQIQSYAYGDASFSDLTAAGKSVLGAGDHFATSEAGSVGYVAYTGTVDGAANSVGFFEATDGGVTQEVIYSLSGGDSLTRLSLAGNSAGGVDVGFFGVLDDKGDADVELYRYTDNRYTSVNSVGSVKPPEVESLFVGENANIRTRPNAYRTLEDLKALRAQINDNRKALEKARQTLGDNLTLVRQAGLAFLELSDQIRTATDADQVASRVRNLIVQNATEALAQAENLRPLALAALNQLTGVSE